MNDKLWSNSFSEAQLWFIWPAWPETTITTSLGDNYGQFSSTFQKKIGYHLTCQISRKPNICVSPEVVQHPQFYSNQRASIIIRTENWNHISTHQRTCLGELLPLSLPQVQLMKTPYAQPENPALPCRNLLLWISVLPWAGLRRRTATYFTIPCRSPCKKRRSGHRHAQKKDHVKTEGEDDHLQAKDRSFRRNQLCQHLDLRRLASRTVRKLTSVM